MISPITAGWPNRRASQPKDRAATMMMTRSISRYSRIWAADVEPPGAPAA
jgi:hypothetical protein